MSKFTSQDLGKSAIKGNEMAVEHEGIITGISEDGWVRLTTPLSLRRSKSEWVCEKDVILFTQSGKPPVSENIRGDIGFLAASNFVLWAIFLIAAVMGFVILCNMSNAILKMQEQMKCNVNVVSQDEC